MTGNENTFKVVPVQRFYRMDAGEQRAHLTEHLLDQWERRLVTPHESRLFRNRVKVVARRTGQRWQTVMDQLIEDAQVLESGAAL